jgi:5'-nucleotidase
VSVDRPDLESRPNGSQPHWAAAAEVGARAVDWLAEAADGTVLNINAPNLPLAEVRGYRWASLAPFGTVRTTVIEPAGPSGGRVQLELRPAGNGDLPAGSDTALVKAGYVTVTRLSLIQATDPVDPTDVFKL